MSRLTALSHRFQELPTGDEVLLTLRNVETQAVYSVSLPWLTFGNSASVDQFFNDSQENTSLDEFINTDTSINDDDAIVEYKVDLARAEHHWQNELNELYGNNAIAMTENLGLTISEIPDSTIRWDVFENKSKKFGYLSLSSMVPQTGFVSGLRIISNLLTRQLADTDGLIIDVRNNGGGFITYADVLPQLFSPKEILPYSAHALKSDLNKLIFVDFNLIGDRWRDAYLNGLLNDNPYSEAEFFTTTEQANLWMGQLYFKPVAVLTNANCYSACDLFTG